MSIKACLFVLSGKLLLKLFICFKLHFYCFRTLSHCVNIVIFTLKFILNNKIWFYTLSSVACSGTLFKRTWWALISPVTIARSKPQNDFTKRSKIDHIHYR